MPDMRTKAMQELLQTVKERYAIMSEADQDNRYKAMYDLKFTMIPGEQWDENMLEQRGKRPSMEFNKLRQACKRVINDMRAERPGAKVRPTEGGDIEEAEIREGLMRNIWAASKGDSIVDYAAEYQTVAGMAAWRVVTEYEGMDGFNQEIRLKPFRNPFTVYSDPQCRDPEKRDARDWCITELMAKEEFEKKYPKADSLGGFTAGDHEFDDAEWTDEDLVRIAEYWWKEPMTKEIWKVQKPDEIAPDGQTIIPGGFMVVDADSDEAEGIPPEAIVDTREIETSKIRWCIASGDRILKVGEWAGYEFPFVMVYGEYIWIDGEPMWWGLPRFARDAQQAYNFARTSIAELIASAPKVQYWATVTQAKGNTEKWEVAHKQNFPYLIYNADPQAPGAPQRMGGADVPVALIQEVNMASEEIKAVTGIYDASYGAPGNETSGRAIFARQQEGEIATFNYKDNMSKGVQRTYEIVLDLIPHIYDTEREVRILGEDGTDKYKRVNQVVEDDQGNIVRIHDLTTGKYDVTVSSGPGYQTLRQEAAEIYGQLAQQFPQLMEVAGDLVMKSVDLPYADEIGERLRTLLPMPIQKMLMEQEDIPPQVMQMMAQLEQQAEMLAVREQELKELEMKAQEEQLQAQRQQTQADIAAKDNEIRIERLRRIKAEFDAYVEKTMASLNETSGENPQFEEAMSSIQAIDQTLAAFMQEVDSQIGQVNAKTRRRPVSSRAINDDGKLYSIVTYSDGSEERIEVTMPDSEDVADANSEA